MRSLLVLVCMSLAVGPVQLHARSSTRPAQDAGDAVPPPAAQDDAKGNAAPGEGAPAAPTRGQGDDPVRGGLGLPPVALGPTQQEFTMRVQVSLDGPATPDVKDFHAGGLVSAQQPDQQVVPEISVVNVAGTANPWTLDLKISRLVGFGELTVPLMYKGRQVETLRFRKTGLILRTPGSEVLVAHQKDKRMLLVVENPSEQVHQGVGVRIRFQDTDVCTAVGDQPATPRPAAGPAFDVGTWLTDGLRRWSGMERSSQVDCAQEDTWSRFTIRPGSQASLWVPMHDAWFIERLSGLARTATRRGVVTLRYFDNGGRVQGEHNLPLEVTFEPTSGNLGWSIGWVGAYLLAGAVLYLLLRVSIPNYRRKKALKESINEARAATATISDALDSQLRVLLRVERLALDQRRRDSWVLAPGFPELTARLEASLAVLTRKIDVAMRIDSATCRRYALLDAGVAPTRLSLIDRHLLVAVDALKGDQLHEADWLFVQQRLDAVEKALSDPSPEEMVTFEAQISERWIRVRDHFGQSASNVPNHMDLGVPAELASMAACFPRAALLPRADDADGRKWISSVGAIRADLQITAFETLRELQFLAAATPAPAWAEVTRRCVPWLAMPSIDTLALARALLRQLSQPANVDEIVAALRSGDAEVEMDPQLPGLNQTVKLSVRFLDPRLNLAKLRDAVQCEWTFSGSRDSDADGQPGAGGGPLKGAASLLRRASRGDLAIVQRERGWVVYRYFESGLPRQSICVAFLRHGKPLEIDPAISKQKYERIVEPAALASGEPNIHDRWLRFGFQALQMMAALLVPLATLAITTAGDGTSGRWWDLVAIGFGSEAIRSILTSEPSASTS